MSWGLPARACVGWGSCVRVARVSVCAVGSREHPLHLFAMGASRRGMFGPLEGPVVSSGVARIGRLSVSPTASCMLSCSRLPWFAASHAYGPNNTR
eukprot:scaffold12688_cov146-Isochrysis_galbana.AAC.8